MNISNNYMIDKLDKKIGLDFQQTDTISVAVNNNETRVFAKTDGELYKKTNTDEVKVATLLDSPNLSNQLQKYVSVNAGNDNYNGQVNRKKQTIESALVALDGQSSAAVECEDGTYAETLTFGTARSRRAIRGSIGAQRVIINRLITYDEDCQQCELHNIKLENTLGGYAIQVNSTLSNFVFDGINVGGNHTNPVAIDVAVGGSGFITITNSDLNNKIINLNNTATPRYCFISNSANIIVNAGTGWIVIKQNCANVLELSNNNNVLEGFIANNVISNDTEYNAIVALGASANGYYLCNYTKAGVFSIGDVILRNHPLTVVDHKHYNANSTYYTLLTQKTYTKKAGIWQEITTATDLASGLSLKSDKIPNALNVADKPTGGVIGTASATVDIYEKANVAQSTASQTLSLPTPTNTANKKIFYVENTGSVSFIIYDITLEVGSLALFIWNGSNWSKIASGGGGGLIQNIYTATNSPSQTLPAGYTGINIPNTITNDITITPDVGAYSSAGFPVPVVNNSTAYKVTIAGFNVVEAGNSALLSPNATATWYPLNDSRYKIITHTLGASVQRLKSLKKLPTGYVLGDNTDNGNNTVTNRQTGLMLVIDVISSTKALVFDGSGKVTLPYTISSIYAGLTSGNIATIDGELYLNNTGDLIRSDLAPTNGNAVIIGEFINDYELDYKQQLVPIIANVISPIIQQAEGNKKNYVLTGGKTTITSGVKVNNILSLTNSNTKVAIDSIATPVQGKFLGATQTLFSSASLIEKLASEIPVFNASNPNLSTTVNINTVGIGTYILAINSALTIFAIPIANFTDAVTDITTSITSGKIGYDLNPLQGYRHNGTALEQYDFILLGQVAWNGSSFSGLINYAYNGTYTIQITLPSSLQNTTLAISIPIGNRFDLKTLGQRLTALTGYTNVGSVGDLVTISSIGTGPYDQTSQKPYSINADNLGIVLFGGNNGGLRVINRTTGLMSGLNVSNGPIEIVAERNF